MKKIIFFLLLLVVFCTNVKALDLAPNAKSAILINYETGTIVYEKNSNEKLPPASMTKMMTLLLVMEQIESGNLKYDDQVIISKNAADMGGSQIFLEANSSMKVEELIKGISISSGNDAAVAMSEKIAGSTEKFVELMNKKCKEIGCKNTNFVNVHGLDENNHYSSAYDMSLIAKELIKHNDILRFTSTYEEYLNKPDGSKIWLVNTNKLVRFMPGVDGLKTGFTSNAGYCLTATGIRNNIRFISVVMGEENTNLRSDDTTNMLNYGFSNYKLNRVVDKNTDIGTINIKKAKQKNIKLKPLEEIIELKEINEENKNLIFETELYKNKLPIKTNDKVGVLKVKENDEVLYEIDITVEENVTKMSFIEMFKTNLINILGGWK